MSETDVRSLTLAIGAVALACVSIAYAIIGSPRDARVMALLAVAALLGSELIL
jgi:hypothetical protein